MNSPLSIWIDISHSDENSPSSCDEFIDSRILEIGGTSCNAFFVVFTVVVDVRFLFLARGRKRRYTSTLQNVRGRAKKV